MSPPKDQAGVKDLAVNRHARHDYLIEETFEAGLVLLGTEVKSARGGRIQIKDAYGRVQNGEAWLVGLHIAPYTHAYHDNHEPERRRKILLHKHEIKRLIGKTERAGYTLVPLRIYLKGTLIKIELGLGKGRAKGEKRDELKKKIVEREMRQDAARRR
jgi:SsrA-binding protein